jgi:hypothetical protein
VIGNAVKVMRIATGEGAAMTRTEPGGNEPVDKVGFFRRKAYEARMAAWSAVTPDIRASGAASRWSPRPRGFASFGSLGKRKSELQRLWQGFDNESRGSRFETAGTEAEARNVEECLTVRATVTRTRLLAQ